jgi:hypothetical protein
MEDGLVLKYRMPEGRVLKYESSDQSVQHLKVEGKVATIESDETRLFSIVSKGRLQDSYEIGLTIDSVAIIMKTPRGVISPDLSALKGKEINFDLSSIGRETGMPDEEDLEYELTPGRKQSIVTGFQAFFPDLPSRPIQIGDTWITEDTVKEESANGRLHLVLQSKNKLDGMETIDGMKCARIIADVTGTLDGEGEEGGIILKTQAEIKGKDTWYFACDEGLFIKMVSSGIAEGNVNGSGVKKVTIPIKRQYNIQARLVR